MWPCSVLREDAGKEREQGTKASSSLGPPRSNGQTRLDVAHVPFILHPQTISFGRDPGLKTSWRQLIKSFSQICKTEMSGMFLGLMISYVSAMEQSGMKDRSVDSSLTPSVPCLPAPVWAAGLSPPLHVTWHFWQSHSRQRSLRTDPAASFPGGRLVSPNGSLPNCAHLVPICLEMSMRRGISPLYGCSCTMLPWGCQLSLGVITGHPGCFHWKDLFHLQSFESAGMHVMHLPERGRVCDKQTNFLTVQEQEGVLQTLKTQNTLQ